MKKPVRYDQIAQLAGFTNTILTMALIAIAATGIYYGVSAYTYQGTQDRFALQLEQNVVSNTSYVESQIVSNATRLENFILNNVSNVNMEIEGIQDALNMTTDSGGTLVTRVTNLENESNATMMRLDVVEVEAIRQINTVGPDMSNKRVNLGAGLGIDVTNDMGTHTVTISNTGVVTINGVPAGNLIDGAFSLSTTAMLSLLNDVNNSRITIDATALVNSINNLQSEDASLAMQIASLQSADSSLQMQIDALRDVGQMLEDNGMDLNMTVLELLTKTMTNEARIEQLEEQLSNLTSVALPIGVLVPWTGPDNMIPDGYLLCDGALYNDVDYLTLSAVIGDVYCDSAPPAGQFCVPDMRGRVPVGRATPGSTFDMGDLGGARGSAVGTDAVQLTVQEMPLHNHGGITDLAAHSHAWPVFFSGGVGPSLPPVDGVRVCQDGGGVFGDRVNGIGEARCYDTDAATTVEQGLLQTNFDGSHSHSYITSTQGGTDAHQNLQPSVIMHYIIKT